MPVESLVNMLLTFAAIVSHHILLLSYFVINYLTGKGLDLRRLEKEPQNNNMFMSCSRVWAKLKIKREKGRLLLLM